MEKQKRHSGYNETSQGDGTNTVFPITVEIAKEAGYLRQSYFKSHGMGLADAMIAATAKAHGATLVSLNVRHFSMLDDLLIPYTK